MNREQFLNDRVSSLLSRLSPPRSISERKDLMAEEMAGIVKLVGAMMPRDGFQGWWQGFEANLLAQHQTRSWPTQYEIRKASESMRAEASNDEVIHQQIIWAGEFFDRHRKACPWFNSEAITNHFLSTGRLRSLDEARHYGFEISQAQREKAKAGPMCWEAWKHHISVMSRLTGKTYDETERAERAAISPSRLPA